MDGHGNLERTWRVRERSGNLKINGHCCLQKLTVNSLFKSGNYIQNKRHGPYFEVSATPASSVTLT